MADPIDFWFDFSSPYGYMMAERIDTLAAKHGREVKWRPFLLGAVFKHTGGQPLPAQPMKGPYSKHDLARSARFLGLPFTMPEAFPVSTHQACRVFYWLESRNARLAHEFAIAVFHAYFVDGRDVSQMDVLEDVAGKLDIAPEAVAGATADDVVKAHLREVCEVAIASGVFGSPFVVIDGEPFWGVDRLPQIERWLEQGGF